MEATPRDLVYTDEFAYWEDSLDPRLRGIVRVRLRRVSKGLFGDSHGVGEGVSELVIDDGPGHRIYFGRSGNKVILLIGGAKKTQPRDIVVAKSLWRRENNG